MKQAIAKADPNGKAEDANPLVENGQQLVPSLTRVFRKDQNLYVYMEVCDPVLEADQKPNVAATLSFYRGKNMMFESQPVYLDSLLPKPGGNFAGPVRGIPGEVPDRHVHMPDRVD